jgi:hypothetical protein
MSAPGDQCTAYSQNVLGGRASYVRQLPRRQNLSCLKVCGGVEGRAPATSPTGFKHTPNDALMVVAGSWMSGGDSRFRDPSFGLNQWGTLMRKKPPSALAWPGYDCVSGGALNDAGEELTFGGRAPFEPREQVPEGCMTFRVR